MTIAIVIFIGNTVPLHFGPQEWVGPYVRGCFTPRCILAPSTMPCAMEILTWCLLTGTGPRAWPHAVGRTSRKAMVDGAGRCFLSGLRQKHWGMEKVLLTAFLSGLARENTEYLAKFEFQRNKRTIFSISMSSILHGTYINTWFVCLPEIQI